MMRPWARWNTESSTAMVKMMSRNHQFDENSASQSVTSRTILGRMITNAAPIRVPETVPAPPISASVAPTRWVMLLNFSP